MPPWYITTYLIFHTITAIIAIIKDVKTEDLTFLFGDGEYIKIKDILTMNNILQLSYYGIIIIIAPIILIIDSGILTSIGNISILKRK